MAQFSCHAMGHVRVLARKDAGVCLGCDEAQKTWKVVRRSVAHFVSVQGFWSLHRAIMEKPRLNSIMCSSDLRQVSRTTLCVVPQMRKIGLPSFFLQVGMVIGCTSKRFITVLL